ncbi:MAG TPA: aminoglycoside phosphotransferase family protein [Candidatus Woesearchaeota archaeon]|nr:aminoglycoside phosphotransferase family protein [Candidatus Woesearchaeota archaeon]
MMVDLESIKSRLSRLDVFLDESSLRLYSEQGLVNEVYTVESNIGRLIIHFRKQSDKHVQLEKVKRVFEVSRFIRKRTSVPVPEVITFGKDKAGCAFLVQKFVDGRKLSSVKDKPVYIRQLAKYIAELHHLHIAGGGYLVFRSGRLRGKFRDYFSFLKSGSLGCLKGIYSVRKELGKTVEPDFSVLRSRLDAFFRKFKELCVGVKSRLLHGDLKFENILVDDNGIVALVDLEWSAAGDPAWDFSGRKDLNDVFFEEYFKRMRSLGEPVDEKSFRLRVGIAWTIRLVFIADTFKRDEETFGWSFREFKENLDKLLLEES